jgi:hypothetical protein
MGICHIKYDIKGCGFFQRLNPFHTRKYAIVIGSSFTTSWIEIGVSMASYLKEYHNTAMYAYTILVAYPSGVPVLVTYPSGAPVHLSFFEVLIVSFSA